MLEFTEDAAPGVRLACQIQISEDLDGLVVHLPASQH
jgi:2Fe-2S ferredoxin